MQWVNAVQRVKEMLTHTIETLDVAWMSSRPVAECLRHARSMRRAARDAAVTFTVTREDCDAAGVSAALWLGSMGRARQCGALVECMRSWAWQALHQARAERRARLAVRGEQLTLVGAA